MAKKYTGIIVPIITPFLEDETVDEVGYRRLIDYLIDNGVHGIFPCGTMGEGPAMTTAEHDRAIRIAVDQAKGRVKIFAGVMDISTGRVIENIKRIEAYGVDAAVITPVFYDRHSSQSEIVRLFEEVAKATDIDLIAYNIPPFVGEKIAPATVVELAKNDHVKGYKDSSGSFNETANVIEFLRDRDDFSILQGTPPQYVASALVGADGCVPGMASMYPRLFAEANAAINSGDIELMKKYHRLICAAGRLLPLAKNSTAGTKFAVSTLGFLNKRVLRPQDQTTPEEEARILAHLEKVAALYRELIGGEII